MRPTIWRFKRRMSKRYSYAVMSGVSGDSALDNQARSLAQDFLETCENLGIDVNAERQAHSASDVSRVTVITTNSLTAEQDMILKLTLSDKITERPKGVVLDSRPAFMHKIGLWSQANTGVVICAVFAAMMVAWSHSYIFQTKPYVFTTVVGLLVFFALLTIVHDHIEFREKMKARMEDFYDY